MAANPPPPPPPRRRGCAARLAVLVLFLAAVGLGWALYYASLPQDMSDLDGPGDKVAARDLRLVLKSAVDRGYPVTLSQAEINGWLRQVLESRQGGLLEEHVSLDGVRVRLTEETAEVIMMRTIFGRPFTTSMFLQIEQVENAEGLKTQIHLHGGPYLENLPRPMRGGRFGQLVVPQGFLFLLVPAFSELAGQFKEEVRWGFEEMARISMEDGKITFDPRPPTREADLLPGSF